MARPQKLGLDYFPLDVDIDQDDKIQLIEALHGTTGFAVVIKLFMRIYKEGYYYDWTETEQLLFSRRVNVNINTLNDIVNDCIKYGIFDKPIYEKYKVLTSPGIQKRYFEATKRRKNVTIVNQFLLINDSQIVNAHINRVNVDINGHITNGDDAESTQSKVKESKVKESKEAVVVQEDEKKENATPAENYLNWFDEFYKSFGKHPTPIQREEIISFIDKEKLEPGQLCLAFKKAGEIGASYAYSRTILNDWVRKRILTVEASIQEEKAFQNKKQQRSNVSRFPNQREVKLPSYMTEKKTTAPMDDDFEQKKRELEARLKKYEDEGIALNE